METSWKMKVPGLWQPCNVKVSHMVKEIDSLCEALVAIVRH